MKRKIMDVALASRKNSIKSRKTIITFLLGLIFLSPLSEAKNFKETPDYLLSKNIVPSKLSQPECMLLSRGLDKNLATSNPGLDSLLSSFIRDIEEDKTDDLYKLFHPRAKIKPRVGGQIIAILRNRYDKDWKLNILRVWSLINPSKQKNIFDCPNTDNYQPISRYGYEVQYFSIIQIHSPRELGRIILTISPKNENLYITGMHIQQWTHMGHDWLYWTKQGNSYLDERNSLEAYKAYDVAQKLLQAPDFIDYKALPEILSTKISIFTEKSLLKLAKNTFKNENILHMGTTLHNEGVGLFFRLQVEKEQPTQILQTRCKELGIQVLAKNWLTERDAGIKCSFNLPHEDSQRDGVLGGFYFSQKQLKSS